MSAAQTGQGLLAETVARQRKASDPEQSVWVSANAGAGKTRVLTERVARLLFHGTPPARILCLTYTKAAAAEMANRLFEQLGTWSTMSDGDLDAALRQLEDGPVDADTRDRARRLFAKALETPGGLKIDTIHAFAQSVLRRFPVEAGLPPHFALMDDREATELLAEARSAVLLRAQSDAALGEALARILKELGELDFDALLAEIRANRRALNVAIRAAGGTGLDDLKAQIGARLGVEPGETGESVRRDAVASDAFPEGALRAALASLRDEGAKSTDEGTADRLSAALDTQDPLERFDRYLAVFLTAGSSPKPRARLYTKGVGEAHPAAVALLDTEKNRLIEAAKHASAADSVDLTGAAMRLADAVLGEYDARKRARAYLDYEDLIEHTGRLLTDPGAAWVLYKLDGGIEHILVDEAQDTAPEQWGIVAALWAEFFAGEGRVTPGERTVFVVGDEKQSIYSFQGAEPQAFGVMRETLASRAAMVEAPFAPVELALSFRSSAAVLDAVDRVFGAAPVAGAFIGSDAPVKHLARRAEAPGLVEINPLERGDTEERAPAWDAPLDYPGAGDPAVRLATRIADRISGWLASGEWVPSKGRAIVPGDIMILVQRRNAFFEEMIRALKAAGVPVAGADRLRVLEQIGVQDLLALGRTVLLPTDDLSLAEVLKSPLCGFDEEDLFDLAYERAGSLWAALFERREDRARFSEAAAFLEKARGLADTLPVFEFYAEILGPLKGRDRLLARLGPEAADPLEEFEGLALAYERLHPPSLQGFLHWVETGSAEIKRDLEHAGGEVRVMTVHGAKGLEAPVVILPDTCRVPSRQHDPRLLRRGSSLHPANEPELVFWRHKAPLEDEVTEATRAEAEARRKAEYWRLLYVAMTRAEDRLHVYGYLGPTQSPKEWSWYGLLKTALAENTEAEALPEGERRLLRSGDPLPANAPQPPTQERASPALPKWAHEKAEAEPMPLRLSPPSTALAGTEQPAMGPFDGGAGARRFLRGTLIHRLLELLPTLPADGWDAAARAFLAQPVLELDPELAEEIARETLAVLNHEAFAPLFGPESRAEMAIAGRVDAWGGAYISGRIDRIVIEPERVRLLDYKTNRPPPETVEGVAEAYLVQLAGYRAVLQDLYPGRPIETALLWTDGPRLMPVPDALLDAALTGAPAARAAS